MAYIWIIFYNYCAVQVCILAFFAPFCLIYFYRYRKSGDIKLPVSEHIQRFFMSTEANWLVCIWAALEAVIWFVIPEFLLLLLVFLKVKNKRQLLKYDILGTLIGTITASVVDHFDPHIMISKIPYIQPNMVKQVEVWYTHLGIFGLIFQPLSGIPYKVFTLTANQFHFFLPAFILFAIIVRMSRYYFFYVVFTNLYPLVHRFVYKHYVLLFFIACFIFTIALLRVYAIYGEQYSVSYAFIREFQFFHIPIKT